MTAIPQNSTIFLVGSFERSIQCTLLLQISKKTTKNLSSARVTHFCYIPL